jgi:hypothetical protein
MDPSCTFGFYLKSEEDLLELTKLSDSMVSHKIFELLDGTKEDYLLLVHDPSVKVHLLFANFISYDWEICFETKCKDSYGILKRRFLQAFDHNESMFDDGADYSIADIASLEGSDFEYLE